MANAYLIWENIPHEQIRDYCEVVGVVIGDYEEAERVVQRLNEVTKDDWHSSWRSHFWRQEVDILTEANCDVGRTCE